jgi:hypothetical protein
MHGSMFNISMCQTNFLYYLPQTMRQKTKVCHKQTYIIMLEKVKELCTSVFLAFFYFMFLFYVKFLKYFRILFNVNQSFPY